MFYGTIWMGSLTVLRETVRGFRYTFNGTVYVENLSYVKLVGIHYELGNSWHDLDASYGSSLLTHGGNAVEQWRIDGFTYSGALTSQIRFAAYYQDPAASISHWDNNGGGDFHVTVTV